MIACVLIPGSSKYPRRVKNFKEGQMALKKASECRLFYPTKVFNIG